MEKMKRDNSTPWNKLEMSDKQLENGKENKRI